jgi:hypothetical protein
MKKDWGTSEPKEIKRIKTVKLYHGKSEEQKQGEKPLEVVGGIEIIYETKDGD